MRQHHRGHAAHSAIAGRDRGRHRSGGGVAGELLRLQRQAGNAAVTQAITIQRMAHSGEKIRPFSVSNGQGTHNNLKWNKASGGIGGKKTYNTGFWCLTSNWREQLHVHFGGGGGLSSGSGVAHHWKNGDTYGASVTNSDLEKIFGGTNVNNWTAATYTIPA